jgi:hypothetical protein
VLSVEVRELRTQLLNYQEMAKALESREPNSVQGKLAELTGRISLLDVNNIRLARKYECLVQEEQEIRKAYYAIEGEHSEKDVLTQKTIGKLREWRVGSTLQLQYLLKTVKSSVPFAEFERVNS